MELEDVNGHAQQQPFYRDFFLPSGKESAEVHIFFGKCKSAFGLDRAVDSEQNSFFGGYLFFHFFPLFGETL